MNTVGYSQQGTGGYLESLNGMTTAIGILNAQSLADFETRLDNEKKIIQERLEGVKSVKEAETLANVIKFKQDTEAIKKRIALEQNKIKADTKLDEKTKKKKLSELKKQQDQEIKDYEKLLSRKEKLALKSIQKQAAAESSLWVQEKNKTREQNKQSIQKVASQLWSYSGTLSDTMSGIAKQKGLIDTRLQGSNLNYTTLNKDITNFAGSSVYVQQSKVNENLSQLVNKGIAFNVEQRAFLMSISDKIANTFDTTDGTLLRLIRIQNADTTAARLGMESALTSFLNSMYKTTEYMTDATRDIRANLYESSALLEAKSATELEFQVQKWLGSMYSSGVSQNTVSNISAAIGQLASGDISGINNGGIGNLLLMAANKSGISISSALNGGLSSEQTNTLMNSIVGYMGSLYEQAKGSNVLAQQMASVYGLKASDLKAAAQMKNQTKSISGVGGNYGGFLNQLSYMVSTMGKRTSVAEMLDNLKNNINYSLAAGVANSPALYGTYMLGKTLQDTVGGINIPSIMTLGTGFDLNATVADLMMNGALAGGIISNFGTLVSAMSNTGTSGIAKAIGLTGGNTVVRSGGTSTSGFIGNSNSGDVLSNTMGGATDSAKSSTAKAVDENEGRTMTDLYNQVTAIYEMFSSIININGIKVSPGDTLEWKNAIGVY